MSRVGKLAVKIPEQVKVALSGLNIIVEGPKGKLEKTFVGPIKIIEEEGSIKILPNDESKEAKAMWGTARSIINNMVKGVVSGYTEELEVNGVGYRASIKGKYLNLVLGKSHGTKIFIPEGIDVNVPKQNIIILSSYDKEKLGQYVATIKRQRPVEPYKGKGIKTKGQYVYRKEGKKG